MLTALQVKIWVHMQKNIKILLYIEEKNKVREREDRGWEFGLAPSIRKCSWVGYIQFHRFRLGGGARQLPNKHRGRAILSSHSLRSLPINTLGPIKSIMFESTPIVLVEQLTIHDHSTKGSKNAPLLNRRPLLVGERYLAPTQAWIVAQPNAMKIDAFDGLKRQQSP